MSKKIDELIRQLSRIADGIEMLKQAQAGVANPKPDTSIRPVGLQPCRCPANLNGGGGHYQGCNG